MAGEIIRVETWVLQGALEGGGFIQITARLPISRNAQGDGYMIDLEGRDDMILSGETPEEVVEETLEALKEDAVYAIETGKRHADYEGVVFEQLPAGSWKSRSQDLVPA
ncbi:MAG: hypothetical protein OXN79_04165 [bacterium]|nr:hypothetical protein [Dehalococcoidia bacterium]MDE0215759.1 hypothetical protein [bacterium]